MRLEGIHHVTCITGDAPGNVDFYTRVLGLRLVKKTVNQDDPTVYHLFYADERGSPGADITFFEYPGARSGRAGAGMVHRVTFRVGTEAALDFWVDRIAAEGIPPEREGNRVRFDDPEGLGLELAAVDVADEPLVAEHPEIPSEHRLRGFGSGVRTRSIWSRIGSKRGGSVSFSPRCSRSSSVAKPGPMVASSNSTPLGSRK